MKLYIKHMVGLTCEAQVKKELERLEIPFRFIDVGVVELFNELPLLQRNQFKENLLQCGFKLHEEKKCILVEKIKDSILEMIQYSENYPIINSSHYLSKKLNHDYTYLANIFSEVTGITIQQYIILNKIEIVKELILLDNLNLTEISYKLNYSSVAHLSGQFKKITGLSPSSYKIINLKRLAYRETL